ncbi:hypothetical protein COCOBI_15-2810 [Coccomyxa sp. Obi]|nr:hypothetical protein COCOBI_15-2810 [Coccomyxa sp. Obi]
MTGVHNILHHVGHPSLDFDREVATGVFRAGMRLVGAREVIVIPYLTVISAIVRFGALLLSAVALLAAAALAARAAYLELRKFIVLFRIPHPPEEALVLGSALAMRRPNHHRSLRAWSKQLGGVYAIRIAGWHVRALSCLSECSRACTQDSASVNILTCRHNTSQNQGWWLAVCLSLLGV